MPLLIQILHPILSLTGEFLDLNHKYKHSAFELMRMVQHRIDNNKLKYMLNKFQRKFKLKKAIGQGLLMLEK